MAVAPGEVSDHTMVHPGMVDGMSTRMNDSGVGGLSAPMLAGPVERAVDASVAGVNAGGGAAVDVVVAGSVVVDSAAVVVGGVSRPMVVCGDVGAAFDRAADEPQPNESASAVTTTAVRMRRVRVR